MARGVRLVLSGTIVISMSALLVLHAAIFWHQVGDGRLLDPATAVRWGFGALLFGAMVALRRAGVSVVWGRRALVAWVLVALLHWTAAPVTDLAGVANAGAQAAQTLVELPLGAAGILAAASLALLLLVAAGLTPVASRAFPRPAFGSGAARAPLVSLHLASRAPPAVLA